MNQTDDQIAPIWFVLVFHLLVHLFGIFVIVTMPSSWQMGTPSHFTAIPPFQLIVLISVLSLVWAFLRVVAFRPMRLPVLVLLLIPVLMSAGTAVYAYTVTKCTDKGHDMLKSRLEYLNQKIESSTDSSSLKRWHTEERDQLLEELK